MFPMLNFRENWAGKGSSVDSWVWHQNKGCMRLLNIAKYFSQVPRNHACLTKAATKVTKTKFSMIDKIKSCQLFFITAKIYCFCNHWPNFWIEQVLFLNTMWSFGGKMHYPSHHLHRGWPYCTFWGHFWAIYCQGWRGLPNINSTEIDVLSNS